MAKIQLNVLYDEMKSHADVRLIPIGHTGKVTYGQEEGRVC
jgi:hypothetical protein